jgi:Putative transposase/Transposase zinc-binding domain
MAQVTVQQILQQGYTAFERSHQLPGYVRKAVWALMACRTAVLGGHVQRCPEGHCERIWYNSCRHRLCPQCSWLQVERWLVRQKARLLACDHYHVIFTLPDELRGVWLANRKPMAELLFATVRATLFELLGDAKYLGARPGMMAAGGGLTEAGEWRAVRNGFLLPVRVVMAVFRGKLLAALRQGVAHGELRLPEGQSRQQMENLLNKLGRMKWNVHIRERYRHGAGVLTYLARYLRGGPLANQRLVACENGAVTFRYRVNGEVSDKPRSGLMTLPIAEFIRRYLRHVPAPGTRVVRSYGLYAPSQGEAVAVCRAQLGQEPVTTPVVLDWQTFCQERGDAHPERCPLCGRRLVRRGVVPRSRIPPPGDGVSEVAA